MFKTKAGFLKIANEPSSKEWKRVKQSDFIVFEM